MGLEEGLGGKEKARGEHRRGGDVCAVQQDTLLFSPLCVFLFLGDRVTGEGVMAELCFLYILYRRSLFCFCSR